MGSRSGRSTLPVQGVQTVTRLAATERLRHPQSRSASVRRGASRHATQHAKRRPLRRTHAVTCQPDVRTTRRRPFDRASRRLPDRPARRGRPGHRARPRARARPPAEHAGDDRVGELRAAGRARRRRLGAHQQVRRGLSGPPLLRRLRGGRRRRAARDRPRQGAVRRRARERPAARGRAGEQRRLHGAARARRHDHGDGARPRRPPHPRDEAERLGQALRGRPVPRAPRGPPGRHGGGRAPRARAPAEGDRRRLVGLPAPPRLRRVPRDRRRGRRQADGGHGPLRRPRRRRRAPEPGRARPRHDDDDPQDALRPAQRDDPLHRGASGRHRPVGLPRVSRAAR